MNITSVDEEEEVDLEAVTTRGWVLVVIEGTKQVSEMRVIACFHITCLVAAEVEEGELMAPCLHH